MINQTLDRIYQVVETTLAEKRFLSIVLIILFTLSFVPRLYKLDNPVADWHSWRQADTASVTRNFVKEGYTPFFPKFDAYNSLNQDLLPNPNRYFFAEFPLYNSVVYAVYRAYDGISLEMYGRLVTAVFSSLTSVVLFLLVRRLSGTFVAMTAALLFALNPFNIYYGRAIMPDAMHVFFGVLTLYVVLLWTKKKQMWYPIAAGLAFMACILTKPYGLVLLLPILYLLWKGFGLDCIRKKETYLFLGLALIPFLAWRWHIQQYPEGMFATAWLFNEGNIRFTGAYFRWMIYDRMNRLILATGGFVLFFVGMLKQDAKAGLFYYLWLVSVLIFFVIIAKGNVTHDYYQMPFVPIASIFMAQGVSFLWTSTEQAGQRLLQGLLSGVLILLMLAFGWYEVRDFFTINRPEIVAAGQFIDSTLPHNAKIIAPYNSDPAFLYQTNRYGWTEGGKQIEQFREKGGATHLAVVDFTDQAQYWIDRCEVVGEEQGKWMVVDLQNCQ
jgi:hypothetical protein